MKIEMLADEFWWGGKSIDGVQMPFTCSTVYEADLFNTTPNATMPYLISSKGRILWSKKPFMFRISAGMIETDRRIVLEETGGGLKEAYERAAGIFMEGEYEKPVPEIFEAPMYSGWIEMGYYPTQEKVLSYAKKILDEGFAPGIFIIDDGWMQRYGKWEFDKGAFPDPKRMVDELHEMGFRVMMWIVPYVAPDGVVFRDARDAGVLKKNPDGSIFFKSWWNGTGCVVDLTRKKGFGWLKAQLDHLVSKYGVDGFKFDGCDPIEPDNEDLIQYARLGSLYPFCELREGFLASGAGFIFRQHDKQHRWDEKGLRALIPNGIAQSMIGCIYNCPDMIGGGDIESLDGKTVLDEELYIRFLQASVLFPVCQFSRLPFLALSENGCELVKEGLKLRNRFMPLILRLANESAATGLPMLSPLAFYYPGEGLETVTQEFLLGRDVLVAPVLEKGAKTRTVMLPHGNWEGFDGKWYSGGTWEIPAELHTIPYFINHRGEQP